MYVTSDILLIQYELGTVPIPKSVVKSHIEGNIKIFDFELTKEEVVVMDSLHTGQRRVAFLDATDSKYYPFSIEF